MLVDPDMQHQLLLYLLPSAISAFGVDGGRCEAEHGHRHRARPHLDPTTRQTTPPLALSPSHQDGNPVNKFAFNIDPIAQDGYAQPPDDLCAALRALVLKISVLDSMLQPTPAGP